MCNSISASNKRNTDSECLSLLLCDHLL